MGKKRKRESLSEVEEASSETEENPDEDYFFDVKKNLKDLFNSAEGCEFSFFGSTLQEENKSPKQSRIVEEESTINLSTSSETPKFFFFHAKSKTLRNRLDENSFVRTESIQELNETWPERRTAMKASFRKRYKETQKVKKRKHTFLSKEL